MASRYRQEESTNKRKRKEKNDPKRYLFWCLFFVTFTLLIAYAINVLPELNPFGEEIQDIIRYLLYLMGVIFIIGGMVIMGSVYRVDHGKTKVLKRLRSFDEKIKNITETDIREVFKSTYYEEEGKHYQNYIYRHERFDEFTNNDVIEVFASVDALEIFNDDVVSMKEHFSFHNYVPHIFISIGIFGTFFGVVSGLQGLTITGDNGVLVNQVTALLSSIQISFRSSLYGIIFSVCYAILYKLAVSIAKKSTYDLASRLNTLIKSDVDMRAIQAIEDSAKSMKINMETMSTNIADSLGNIMTESFDNLSKLYENSIGNMTETISTSVSQVGAESMSNVIAPLNDLIENIRQQFEENKELLGLIQRYNQQFESNLEKYTDVSQKFNTRLDSSQQVIEKMSKDMESNLEQAEEYMLVIRERNEEYIDKLTENISEGQKEYSNYIQAVEASVKSIDDSNTDMKERVSEVRSFIHNAIQSQRAVTESLTDYKQMVDDLSKNINENMYEYNKKVNSGLTTMFAQYDDHASKVLSNINDLTSELCETINGFNIPLEQMNENISNLAKERELVAYEEE